MTRSAASGRYRVVNPGLALMTELLGRRDRLRRTELGAAELAAQHEARSYDTGRGDLVVRVEGSR